MVTATKKPAPGFAILTNAGEVVGSYSSATDKLEDAKALRDLVLEMGEGFYWLITIRADRFYLNHVEITVGADDITEVAAVALTRPATHKGWFTSYAIADAVRESTRALRNSALRGLKVPAGVIDHYLTTIS